MAVVCVPPPATAFEPPAAELAARGLEPEPDGLLDELGRSEEEEQEEEEEDEDEGQDEEPLVPPADIGPSAVGEFGPLPGEGDPAPGGAGGAEASVTHAAAESELDAGPVRVGSPGDPVLDELVGDATGGSVGVPAGAGLDEGGEAVPALDWSDP